MERRFPVMLTTSLIVFWGMSAETVCLLFLKALPSGTWPGRPSTRTGDAGTVGGAIFAAALVGHGAVKQPNMIWTLHLGIVTLSERGLKVSIRKLLPIWG